MSLSISVEYDDGQFQLVVSDGKMRPMVAGPRLFRIPKRPPPGFRLPEIAFTSDTLDQAEGNARKLRAYLASDQTKQRKEDIKTAEVDDLPPHHCTACRRGPLFAWDEHKGPDGILCPKCFAKES